MLALDFVCSLLPASSALRVCMALALASSVGRSLSFASNLLGGGATTRTHKCKNRGHAKHIENNVRANQLCARPRIGVWLGRADEHAVCIFLIAQAAKSISRTQQERNCTVFPRRYKIRQRATVGNYNSSEVCWGR